MSTFFSDTPVRKNGQDVDAQWWNLLRTAGLNLESQAGSLTKYTNAFGAFSTAGLTFDLELFSLSAREMIDWLLIKHSTAFSGGSITALTMSVGIAADLTKYAVPFDVFQATGDTVFAASAQASEPETFGGATSIRLAATAVGDNLDQLAAGSVDVWVRTSTLPA